MIIYVFTLIAIGASIFYVFKTWKYGYWKSKGIVYVEPEFPYGNSKAFATRALSLGDLLKNFYFEFKEKGEKYGGIFFGFHPCLVPVDPDILKTILQKDFGYFMDRGNPIDEEIDPLQGHLFNLNGEKWRNLRTKLTPTFTSGKMKMMFPTMTACTVGLKDILENHVKIGDAVNIKDVLARFTTDIIGSVAFGIDCNSLKNPDSEFIFYGKKSFQISKRTWKTYIRRMVPPKVWKVLGFKFKNTLPEVENFFMDVINSTVNYRETNDVYRKDVLHLLLQLKNIGKVNDDEKIFANEEEKNVEGMITFNQLAAQCFVFFIAGFETSSTAMTFALLELSLNQDVQDRLRDEIRKILQKHNNEVTYEAINEMTYLDHVVQETLRKYPSLPFLPRMCSENYKFSETGLTIEKGILVMVPVMGIHYDPDYYPKPEVFDPERFNEENKAKRPQFTFLPFGDGPRICIGARFGLLQTKVGLIAILKKFQVTMNDKTKFPLEYSAVTGITSVKGDVWLNVANID